jgi:transposase InsO family protein
LVGLFKKAKGEFTHIFFIVNKFIKWVKVKPAASITAAKAVEFIREIVYRLGVPNNIITDNGTRFIAKEFQDFCVDSGIKINYASVSHPQSNGRVERSNGMIIQGLKPRIFDRLKPYAGKWVKELLWATHHFPWFMGLSQCYLWRWSTNLFECSISMKNKQMTPKLMI